MKEATRKTATAGGADRCEYLGLRDDPQTALGFPSPWNCCYRARPIAPVRLEYQRVFCQTAAHGACAMLRQEKVSALPPDIRGHGSSVRPKSAKAVLNISFVLLAAVALGAILWRAAGGFTLPAPNWDMLNGWYQHLPFIAAQATAAPTPTLPSVAPVNVPAASPLLVLPSPSPAPTWTPLPQAHALEAPIRVGNETFVIHRVLGGETFDQLTKVYETTPDAIRALNKGLTGSLWVDTVIVIAPGMTAVDPSLPVFETYQVYDDTVTIDQLADMFAIARGPVRAYNGCEDNCQLVKGDWIIVPHSQ